MSGSADTDRSVVDHKLPSDPEPDALTARPAFKGCTLNVFSPDELVLALSTYSQKLSE